MKSSYNRACKIGAGRIIDRMPGVYGEKAAKKYDKRMIKRQRRTLEKREARRVIDEE